ncbi:cytochrome P450 [Pholiota molesta]|nr:cytochrome P450 [Pholiota molesta]
MELPPGPLYLLKLLPYAVLPSATVLAFLRLIEIETGACIPIWSSALAVLAIHPVLFILKRSYSQYADAKAAAANNAFLPPPVKEQLPHFAGLSIMKRMVQELKDGYPGDGFLEWMEEYGPTYQLRLLSDNRMVTAEPEHIKQILATQFDAYEKGPAFNSQFSSLLGTGVFNSDGEMWKFHRSMTRPFFTRDRISHFDMFDINADSALKQARARLQEGYPIDFQDLVSRFTLDSATQFLFGHNVESLSAGLPYPESSPLANSATFRNHPSNVFVDAFLQGQILSSIRGRTGPSWPLQEFWGDKIKPLREIMDKFTEPVLMEALRKRNMNADGKVDEDDTLLSHLIQRTQDVTVLKDELLNLLVAGRDTTACTLTFALYMLCENPKIAERLHKEIADTVDGNNRPTYDNIRDMKYLRAFINEVLRLYPAVPFDSRTSNRPTVLDSKTPGSTPYYVPANTKVIYAIMLMHRRKDLWGPDALEFDPDRFLDARLHKYLTPNPFIFSPFNAGPRICLGQQFAYQETSFFLVRLLQGFRGFRMAPDAQPLGSRPPEAWAAGGGRKAGERVVPGTHLTMYVKGGLWIQMDERKSEFA